MNTKNMGRTLPDIRTEAMKDPVTRDELIELAALLEFVGSDECTSLTPQLRQSLQRGAVACTAYHMGLELDD